MRYRVRDKDWAELWGEELSWSDANRLKDRILLETSSRTARVEAMDMGAPPHLLAVAGGAQRRMAARNGGIVEASTATRTPPLPPPPPSSVPVPVKKQFVEDPDLSPITPILPMVDPQLSAIQSSALAAAGKEASNAQVRSDAAIAAARRREEYKKQREAAEKENERLQKEAEEMEKQFGDASDVPEGDIDDLLGGVGSMPTDEEIRKAREAKP